ncbi:hypothetical protein IAQ61_004399 [Plenodomus lingam]|uniref:uncharacterized protein n=1 Tax=Leptosphaeria maculans TaxID=5022 RepID=UPI003321B597|nr:hypothetical protein IAQ61_004399 [Plenodomus lingam]
MVLTVDAQFIRIAMFSRQQSATSRGRKQTTRTVELIKMLLKLSPSTMQLILYTSLRLPITTLLATSASKFTRIHPS